jgi:hypothetical protein
LLVLISHGSGGVGAGEYHIAESMLANGYTVGILDYFSAYGIQSLGWVDHGPHMDLHDVLFKDMFDIQFPEYKKIVHIGSSLGGYFGLYHSDKFIKNYCFYPGIIALTNQLLLADYSNTTVFSAANDDWCDNYTDFESQCRTPPHKIVVDAHHGFLITDKSREILVTKYNTTARVLSITDFNKMKPNIYSFKTRFTKIENLKIHLQNHPECSTMCINHILAEITHL